MMIDEFQNLLISLYSIDGRGFGIQTNIQQV